MSNDAPVMIMAGGTGGHIFPALAVADALRNRNIPVVWLGSQNSMEAGLIPRQGIPFIGLGVTGVRGKGLFTMLLMPFKLVWAMWRSMLVIRRQRPQAVLGMGGFASGPGGLAAVIMGKPLYIQEQNAVPGMTNRVLARYSRCVMEGFPDSFKDLQKPVLFTGNPVRHSIAMLAPTAQRHAGRDGPIRVLVLGGSRGARRLNESVPDALSLMDVSLRPQICHQTGGNDLALTRERYQVYKINAEVVDFIDDMAAKYAWADLVVARAGALTITELSQAGLASVLVPYPYAVDDHQTVNASVLVKRGAAILIQDQEVTAQRLNELLQPLLEDRTKLIAMGEKAYELARPDAAEQVMQVCLGEVACEEVKA